MGWAQSDGESGVPRCRPHRERPAVPVHHDAPRDVEAEPCALADGFCGEEGLENAVADTGIDSGAGVGDFDKIASPVISVRRVSVLPSLSPLRIASMPLDTM